MAGGGISPRPVGHAGRLRRRRSGRLEEPPRHCDYRTSSARGENQSSAGSIATFNSACQYSCRTEQRPSDPNRSVRQPDAVRGSRVAGS